MNPSYGITRELPDLEFDQAVTRTTEALKEQGFGVLTEIDVQSTLKKKLNVEMPRYVILGACNPPLAHQALSADPAIGLLLPCNVIVVERAEGGTTVSALKPSELFAVVKDPRVDAIARQVEEKLARAIDSL